MLSKAWDWCIGKLVDWLFPELFEKRYCCEFEKNHGWLPKPGKGYVINDSGIHGEWDESIIVAEDKAIADGNGAFAE